MQRGKGNVRKMDEAVINMNNFISNSVGGFNTVDITPEGCTKQYKSRIKSHIRYLMASKQVKIIGYLTLPRGGKCNVYTKTESWGNPESVKRPPPQSAQMKNEWWKPLAEVYGSLYAPTHLIKHAKVVTHKLSM